MLGYHSQRRLLRPLTATLLFPSGCAALLGIDAGELRPEDSAAGGQDGSSVKGSGGGDTDDESPASGGSASNSGGPAGLGGSPSNDCQIAYLEDFAADGVTVLDSFDRSGPELGNTPPGLSASWSVDPTNAPHLRPSTDEWTYASDPCLRGAGMQMRVVGSIESIEDYFSYVANFTTEADLSEYTGITFLARSERATELAGFANVSQSVPQSLSSEWRRYSFPFRPDVETDRVWSLGVDVFNQESYDIWFDEFGLYR